MQTLSIVIPAYNEARFIGELLDRVIAVDLRHHGVAKEIIVIDDASTDDTAAIARARPGVRVLTQPVNRGKGAAVRRGIEAATGHWILIQDADLEGNPNDIHKLVSAAIYGEFQAVYGSRNLRGNPKPAPCRFSTEGETLSIGDTTWVALS
jgi:glycosyltransferase involved in cell wall biosynthesis